MEANSVADYLQWFKDDIDFDEAEVGAVGARFLPQVLSTAISQTAMCITSRSLTSDKNGKRFLSSRPLSTNDF